MMVNRVCEKCIHYDVCLLHEDNFIDDVSKNGFCGKFKNKADFVEEKHGEWVSYELSEDDDGYGYGDNEEEGMIWYKCSVCETDALGRCYDDEWYSYPIRTDYCPKCGADLRTLKERGVE